MKKITKRKKKHAIENNLSEKNGKKTGTGVFLQQNWGILKNGCKGGRRLAIAQKQECQVGGEDGMTVLLEPSDPRGIEKGLGKKETRRQRKRTEGGKEEEDGKKGKREFSPFLRLRKAAP